MHVYISTACHHDRHELCRLVCKYCGAPCVCDHHFIEGVTVTEPVDNPATPDVDLDDTDPIEAQARDVDPDGDPEADDPGELIEPVSDTDPEPQLNDDADDDLADVPEGDDGDEDLDGDDD